MMLFCFIVFENKDKIVIVMEYASKGELYDYISERRRLTERETRHFFRQIVSAVHYCHKVRTSFISLFPLYLFLDPFLLPKRASCVIRVPAELHVQLFDEIGLCSASLLSLALVSLGGILEQTTDVKQLCIMGYTFQLLAELSME